MDANSMRWLESHLNDIKRKLDWIGWLLFFLLISTCNHHQ